MMPPPSSPVPRLSSVPSAASTVHTIASRSLSHQVTPSPKGRAATPSASGRCYRHTSPPHRHTSPPIDQQQGSASTVCHHARLVLVLFPPSVGEGRAEQTSKRKKEREPGRRMPPPSSPVPRLSSVPSAASTVHDLASTSLPSSSAVPVILRPDLVRSLSSVRPSVFLFLVPRSPSCLLTAKANASRSLSHQVTPSPEREGFTPSGSCRDTIATTSTPTSNRDGRTSARPSARLSLPVW